MKSILQMLAYIAVSPAMAAVLREKVQFLEAEAEHARSERRKLLVAVLGALEWETADGNDEPSTEQIIAGIENLQRRSDAHRDARIRNASDIHEMTLAIHDAAVRAGVHNKGDSFEQIALVNATADRYLALIDAIRAAGNRARVYCGGSPEEVLARIADRIAELRSLHSAALGEIATLRANAGDSCRTGDRS